MNLTSEDGNIAFLNIPGFHFLCHACEEATILKTTINKVNNSEAFQRVTDNFQTLYGGVTEENLELS